MTHYVALTTQKYVAESLEKEAAQQRDKRSWTVLGTFATLSASLAYLAILLYAWNQLPNWVSMIQGWII